MCGIAGVVNSGLDREKLEKILSGMQQQLHHRGPDDRGLFISSDGKTGLVNTRLAILDLSSAGHQPMASADGRYRIVLNGEIYNFQALRGELEAKGETFLSRSDTEVVLKMYERHGPDCVRELEGMFALAIWDDQQQVCFLARDPFGIKPLYYYETNGAVYFASELRTLLGTGFVPRRLALEAVSGYLLFGAVPEPPRPLGALCHARARRSRPPEQRFARAPWLPTCPHRVPPSHPLAAPIYGTGFTHYAQTLAGPGYAAPRERRNM